ncbi:MAG: S41 family peptidase [Bacteriovoracia bacterium]
MGSILKRVGALFALVCLLFSFQVWSKPLQTKEEQIHAFHALLLELKANYGMIGFKTDIFGVTFESVQKKFEDLIASATTLEEYFGYVPRQQRDVLSLEEFRQLMVALSSEFKDGHLNTLKQSRDFYTIGIHTAAINGRLYVVGFNPDIYVPGSNPLPQVGDEIIEINGKSVEELGIQRLAYISTATYLGRFNRSIESLLNSSGMRFWPEKVGAPVRVTFRRAASDKSDKAEKPARYQDFEGHYAWVNSREKDRWESYFDALYPQRVKGKNEETYAFGDRSTKSFFSEGLKKQNLKPGEFLDVGALLNMDLAKTIAKSKIDNLRAEIDQIENGKINPSEEKMASNPSEPTPVERLRAYTVRYGEKNIGVIRIPDYSPPGGFQEAVNELRWLARVVQRMENSTDGIIIDQVSNGGGFVFYVAELVRLFAHKKPMETVSINLKLSESILQTFEKQIATREKANTQPPQPYEELAGKENFTGLLLNEKFVEELRRKYEMGEEYSGLIPYGSMSNVFDFETGSVGRMVGREKYTYSKPVVVLNDSRSASGGDFMPSILQANGRALIVGETSLGLGGPVYRSQSSVPGSEMFIRCTQGYCELSNGIAFENLGAVPDVEKWVEPEDLRDGFRGYTKDILDTAIRYFDGKPINDLRKALVKPEKENPDELSELSFIKGLVSSLDAESMSSWRSLRDLLVSAGKDAFSSLSADDWRKVKLGLPAKLVSRDLLLGSLRRKDTVLSRLVEMIQLDAVKKDKELVEQIELIQDVLEMLGNVQILGCSDYLEKFKKKKD